MKAALQTHPHPSPPLEGREFIFKEVLQGRASPLTIPLEGEGTLNL
jgi:hypothetical protein